jgi:hypothetical protein
MDPNPAYVPPQNRMNSPKYVPPQNRTNPPTQYTSQPKYVPPQNRTNPSQPKYVPPQNRTSQPTFPPPQPMLNLLPSFISNQSPPTSETFVMSMLYTNIGNDDVYPRPPHGIYNNNANCDNIEAARRSTLQLHILVELYLTKGYDAVTFCESCNNSDINRIIQKFKKATMSHSYNIYMIAQNRDFKRYPDTPDDRNLDNGYKNFGIIYKDTLMSLHLINHNLLFGNTNKLDINYSQNTPQFTKIGRYDYKLKNDTLLQNSNRKNPNYDIYPQFMQVIPCKQNGKNIIILNIHVEGILGEPTWKKEIDTIINFILNNQNDIIISGDLNCRSNPQSLYNDITRRLNSLHRITSCYSDGNLFFMSISQNVQLHEQIKIVNIKKNLHFNNDRILDYSSHNVISYDIIFTNNLPVISTPSSIYTINYIDTSTDKFTNFKRDKYNLQFRLAESIGNAHLGKDIEMLKITNENNYMGEVTDPNYYDLLNAARKLTVSHTSNPASLIKWQQNSDGWKNKYLKYKMKYIELLKQINN